MSQQDERQKISDLEQVLRAMQEQFTHIYGILQGMDARFAALEAAAGKQQHCAEGMQAGVSTVQARNQG